MDERVGKETREIKTEGGGFGEELFATGFLHDVERRETDFLEIVV